MFPATVEKHVIETYVDIQKDNLISDKDYLTEFLLETVKKWPIEHVFQWYYDTFLSINVEDNCLCDLDIAVIKYVFYNWNW